MSTSASTPARTAHARTFSQFFATQSARAKKMEISIIPRKEISQKPDLAIREFPGLAEMRAEEAEDREIRLHVRSMMGGTRTIAPHPNAVRTTPRPVIEPAACCELQPRVHPPKRDPGVAIPVGVARYVGDDAARDHAKKVRDAQDHVAALRDTLAMAELRLAKLL